MSAIDTAPLQPNFMPARQSQECRKKKKIFTRNFRSRWHLELGNEIALRNVTHSSEQCLDVLNKQRESYFAVILMATCAHRQWMERLRCKKWILKNSNCRLRLACLLCDVCLPHVSLWKLCAHAHDHRKWVSGSQLDGRVRRLGRALGFIKMWTIENLINMGVWEGFEVSADEKSAFFSLWDVPAWFYWKEMKLFLIRRNFNWPFWGY